MIQKKNTPVGGEDVKKVKKKKKNDDQEMRMKDEDEAWGRQGHRIIIRMDIRSDPRGMIVINFLKEKKRSRSEG